MAGILSKTKTIASICKFRLVSICLLIVISSSLVAKENKHSQKAYPFRKISSPIVKLGRKRKIVVCSPPRSGSTLVYMVLQYLFEEKVEVWNSTRKKVIKFHDFKKAKNFCKKHKETFIVVPVRNPVDSLFSYVIATKGPYSDVRKEMLPLTPGYVNTYFAMHNFIGKFSKGRILVCHYDDSTKDIGIFLRQIEKKFHFRIPEEEKIKIKKMFSPSAIKKFARQYPSFKEMDPITGVHGNHISSHKYRITDYLSPYEMLKMYDRFEEVLPLFGFPKKPKK